MALGGMMGALAVVIMSLGTLIPIATYACPMLCCLLLKLVDRRCGSRIGWAWFGAVAILSLLLAPDKEAAAVFCAIGYYPILKPRMDTLPLCWLWKGLLFNASIVTVYWLLMQLMGLESLTEEPGAMGTVLLLATLALGNVTFFLLDRLLGMQFRRRR